MDAVQKMMTTTIRRETIPDGRRILMISDLHGHAEGLKTLLKQAGFGRNDVLVIVGDYVEKGPESLQTIRYVMELCSRYTVWPVMGNVDLWRLRSLMSDDGEIQRNIVQFSLYARQWWPSTLLDEMCAECGITLDEHMDTQKVFPLLRKHFEKELAFLQNLPTILETQRMIFVHGGIPHERLDELMGTPSHPLMKWDHFMDEGLTFEKYVAVGHWPVTLYGKRCSCCSPVIDRKRRILSLDGGCGVKDDGQLNLVILPDWRSDDFTIHTWCPLPKITALDAQEAYEDSGYIHWGDQQVELVERMGELARIRHHEREMTVPADWLYEKDGQLNCSDFSDYHLPVSPGDQLYLVCTAPLGAYVKKDGCTGWYTGRYTQSSTSDGLDTPF